MVGCKKDSNEDSVFVGEWQDVLGSPIVEFTEDNIFINNDFDYSVKYEVMNDNEIKFEYEDGDMLLNYVFETEPGTDDKLLHIDDMGTFRFLTENDWF